MKTTSNDFVDSYIDAILWTAELESGKVRIPRATLAKIKSDCEGFIYANQELIDAAIEWYGVERCAIDFWLTRNRHGAGYWEGDLPKELGEKLTTAAHAVGEQCVGSYRGWLYIDG